MSTGHHNRIEEGRFRRLSQICMGNYNTFSQGCYIWPNDVDHPDIRIKIGNGNYFNKNTMIDACGYIEIGNDNMFGPDIYITDSNHHFGKGISPKNSPMDIGRVKIGNECWIGAKAIILKNVELGDGCVVGAGSVVTKSFSSGSIIAGVPAKLLKSIN